MTRSRRRLALILALGTTGAALVLVACGFPSPLLSDLEPTPDAGLPEPDAFTAPDVISDGPDLDDVPYIDADKPEGIVENPGGKIDAAACADNDCDCDKDTFKDLEKAACKDAGGKNDCDDLDSRAHPGQGYLEDPAEPPMNGDWDCSGKVDKIFPRTNISCGLLSDCSEGFAGNPPCGTEAEYRYCAAPIGILLCTTVARGKNTQACK